ncbi:MAG: thiamine pyrophosphate-binding protein [Chloroflexi bacterium]|nr:thiamine pyrophosphate-binding protein [Chloroflexota bacterium]
MAKYGSDLIADLLNCYDFPYVAFNPGASFRGTHDSILNYAGNRPPIVECQHEKIAIGLAHGYAKATNKPMAVFLHNLVGLMHAPMGIYYAYVDRAPMMILGASGPMAAGRRRRTDWDHTAVVQGDLIRDIVKWDDQPFDADGAIHGFARGYRIARTEPTGPVYICYDVSFQEDELPAPVELPNPAQGGLHSRLAMEPAALAALVPELLKAQRPVIMAENVGRNHERVQTLVELAEFLAAPVLDLDGRLNFPNTHPLFTLGSKVLTDADLVLSLDVRDLYGTLAELTSDKRPTGGKIIPKDCRVISIGVDDLETSSWAQNSMRFAQVDLSILADTYVALPEIVAACKARAAEASPESSVNNRAARMHMWREKHHTQRARWLEEAKANPDASPMAIPHMVLEVGRALQGKDWVLTGNTVLDWSRKLWDFDQPYRHAGKHQGTGTQIGIAIGVALAYRGTGKLVVDLQPDGDLMYDVGALWTASKNRIPLLVVMYNNRAYNNSWDHQYRIAGWRGRTRENVPVGTEIDGPPPDFAGLARSLGWYAEGPIMRADALGPALARAIRFVETEGKPALVDAVTERR